MLINLRNALMAGKRLPYDAEVEYLESTGTPWIDTGFKFEVGCGVNLDVQMTGNVAGAVQILAAASAKGGCWFGAVNSGGVLRYGVGVQFGQYIDTLPAINRAYLRGVWGTTTQLTADGYSAARIGRSTTPTDNIGLFANYGGAFPALCKIYSAKVLDANRNVVRDFIPVRVGTVGYLYDRVSGALFGNAGTGDFVLGPDGAGVRAMKPIRVGTNATSWEGAMMDVLTRRIYRNAGTGAFGYGNDLKYPIPAE